MWDNIHFQKGCGGSLTAAVWQSNPLRKSWQIQEITPKICNVLRNMILHLNLYSFFSIVKYEKLFSLRKIKFFIRIMSRLANLFM